MEPKTGRRIKLEYKRKDYRVCMIMSELTMFLAMSEGHLKGNVEQSEMARDASMLPALCASSIHGFKSFS